jgi:hypothetical protein
MGLLGVTSLAQLNPSWVPPAQPVRTASKTTAYPWYYAQHRVLCARVQEKSPIPARGERGSLIVSNLDH